MTAVPQRPTPDIEALKQFYVGKDANEVPKPAAIMDAAKVRRHCKSMLDAAKALGVGFRAHVKTHKTTQIAQLQVGQDPSAPANLIVSTMAELEHLLPLLTSFHASKRPFNVLYGLPLPSSQVSRLATVARALGPGSISVLVDHPAQLSSVSTFASLANFPAGVYLKVDTGYHRAGLPPSALNKGGLLERIVALEAEGRAELIGLYSHSSLSYADTTPRQAMDNLAKEIEGCVDALQQHASLFPREKEVTVSVGASPQVVSIENITASDAASPDAANLLNAVRKVAAAAGGEGVAGGLLRTTLELHAGVYAVLDMQQLATNARGTLLGGPDGEVALSVVAEVCSVYNDGERAQPEALVAVGTLGLGREPCPSYSGWGVVSRASYAPGGEKRLVVQRISQEHSVVAWEAGEGRSGTEEGLLPVPLEIGESVRIYPNHACVTGALYGWYLVVDSSEEPSASKIVDVWVRASGW